jgi:hypothetical protein
MEMTMTEPITKSASITKVASSKAASIIATAETLSYHDAAQRAYDLDHLDREMTPEENVEFCACMRMPTNFYVE